MKIKSYAKINLALDIVSKPYTKNGYHQIRTVFQQIQLHDVITYKKRLDKKIILSCSHPKVPLNQKNTIIKVLNLLKKEATKTKKTKHLCGLSIHLQKNIPVAAGLGGGSSNAATMLRAANTFWKLDFSLKKLSQIAKKIGMDVPFFLYGGTALGTHYGEKIKRLPSIKKCSFLLIIPQDVKESTRAIYKALKTFPTNQNHSKTEQLLAKISTSQKPLVQCKGLEHLFHNDFDVLYQKSLPQLKKELQPFKVTKISISGSGPSVYAFFASTANLKKAYTFLKKSGQCICKIQTIF